MNTLLGAFLLAIAATVAPMAAMAGEKELAIQSSLDALPERVRAMRDAILEAARTGDIEEMRPVLESNELMPTVSFGGASDPIAYWKESSGDKKGREILAILVEILEMPFVRLSKGTSNEMFVWPYLAEIDLEKLTPEQEVDLYRLVKPVEVKAMQEFGGYIWYRLGIGPDGTWHFFVAGD
ncbi:MAG: hypothetical protein ACR2OX_04690 [Methyloligellaceae bacterium]